MDDKGIDLGIRADPPRLTGTSLPAKGSKTFWRHVMVGCLASFGLCGGCLLLVPSEGTRTDHPQAILGRPDDVRGGDPMLAIDPQSLIQDLDHAEALGRTGDTEAYLSARDAMLSEGRLFFVARGTRVAVLSEGSNPVAVRILEGRERGRTGFITPPWVIPLR